MKHYLLILNNEEGSAIVIALLALAALSIMGISSINTSTLELQIVRNEQIYQTNFYQAEAAVLEAAQTLALESNVDEVRPDATTKYTAWLVNNNTDLENVVTLMANDAIALLSTNASFAANAEGIVSGASLNITGDSNIYGFKIYGYSRDNDGNVLITIGFKKRI